MRMKWLKFKNNYKSLHLTLENRINDEGVKSHELITASSAVRDLKFTDRQCDIWIRKHLGIQQLLLSKLFPGMNLL